MACKKCINMVITRLEDAGPHHHKMCPKYKTEKFPYLFYYEEAENCWIPAPDRIKNIASITDSLDEGEIVEIKFQRIDYTDKEFNALPLN